MVLGLLVAVGLALALLAWIAQGRQLARPRLSSLRRPAVSILKPLRGADPGLVANLESFFALDYPRYELVFAVADADDPAVAIVEELAGRHPGFPARLVVSGREVGLNPKVNNLANAAAVASHDLLLVSDSNVKVEPGYLADLVAHHDAGAALVTSPIRGSGESGMGGAIEALQLNTFVMGGVAAWSAFFGQPCVVGKSMLLSRGMLEEIGGWAFLGRFLAEDQVCGEEIARRGGRIALSALPVDNRLGRLSVVDAARRHLRWARLRRRLTAPGYAAELVLNPLGLALLSPLALPLGAALKLIGLAWLAMSLLAWSAERRLGLRRAPWFAPLTELVRAALVLVLWPLPFLGSTVGWRGRRLRIAGRTRLVPGEAEQELLLEAHVENAR